LSEKILEEHRKMFVLSGQMSDFQINNMKIWFYGLFNPKELEIQYDFTEGENGIIGSGKVEFISNITIPRKKDDKELFDIKCKRIESWIKTLFFEDTKIIIKNKKRVLYESDRI
jgi:hypothetical protein